MTKKIAKYTLPKTEAELDTLIASVYRYAGRQSRAAAHALRAALATIHDATSVCRQAPVLAAMLLAARFMVKRRFLSRIALFLLKARLKVPAAPSCLMALDIVKGQWAMGSAEIP
ncbi:MAG: hypothetical protein LBT01_02685 [Spirochaetaceae bacterium]|jgi:hypothetical protein|nr:hypothetical protein [Spirochaetaceae bacterium]